VGEAARKGWQTARDAVSSQPRGNTSWAVSTAPACATIQRGPLFRTIDRSTGKLNPHDAAGERVCDDPPLRRPGIGTKLGKPKVGVKEVELVTQIGLTRSDAFV